MRLANEPRGQFPGRRLSKILFKAKWRLTDRVIDLYGNVFRRVNIEKTIGCGNFEKNALRKETRWEIDRSR